MVASATPVSTCKLSHQVNMYIILLSFHRVSEVSVAVCIQESELSH